MVPDLRILRRGLAGPLGSAQRHFSIFLDFWAGRKSSMLGVWAAPGGRETLPKGGGRFPAGPKTKNNWNMSLSSANYWVLEGSLAVLFGVRF